MGEGGRQRVHAASGAPLRMAPGAAHHAGLRRDRVARLPRLSVPFRRPKSRADVDRFVSLPHTDADLHRYLHAHLPASGPDTDVEPGGGGRVLRGAAADGLPAAGGVVPPPLATRTIAGRLGS